MSDVIEQTRTEVFLSELQSLEDLPADWQEARMAVDNWSMEEVKEAVENEIALEASSGAWPENLKAKDFLSVLNSYFVPVYVYIGEASGEFSFKMKESWSEKVQCKRCAGRGRIKDSDCSKCSGQGLVSETQTKQYVQNVNADSKHGADFVSSSLSCLECRNEINASPSKTTAKEFLTDHKVIFSNSANGISEKDAYSVGRKALANAVERVAKEALNSGDEVVKKMNANISIVDEAVFPVFVEVLAGHLEYEGEKLYIEVCRSTRELNPSISIPKSVKKGLVKFWAGFFTWHVAIGLLAATQGVY